jgi:hypothetical protein
MTKVVQQRHEDEPQSRRLRVLLVEHHPLIREGLRRFLEDERCLRVAPQHSCAITGTGKPSFSRCARPSELHRVPWLDDTGSPINGGGDLVSPLSTTRSFA